MADTSPSLALLSLVTSPERAESIEGDLIEESQTRGRLWFWSQVLRTSGAFCLRTPLRSPFEALGLAICGLTSWFVTSVLLVTVVDWIEMLLQVRGVPVAIRATAVLVFSLFLTAVVIVRIAPRRGIVAVVSSAVLVVPVATIAGILNVSNRGAAIDFGDFVVQSVLAFATGLLLLATAFLRRRNGSPKATPD